MYHGCRRWVCSLACVFCILSMLFLDTCTVKASTVKSFSFVTTFYPNAVSNSSYGVISGGGGTIYNGNGSITQNTGRVDSVDDISYSYHVKIPLIYSGSWSELGLSGNYYDNQDKIMAMFILGLSVSNTSGNVSNVGLYLDNKLVKTPSTGGANTPAFLRKVTEMQAGDASNYSIPFILEYDVSYASYHDDQSRLEPFYSTINISIDLFSRVATQQEIDASKTQVNDESGNQSLDSIESSSNFTAANTANTADNTSGILSKITDFFGSFFENLIGIFVPEDGYFSGWFDRVNTLLSDKLGMLYAPFDLVISTLQAIYSADSTETGIPFPGIKWEDTWLVEPFTFTFASLGSDFDDLRDKVYFATDTVLVLTFLMLLQSKVKLILEGHE